MIRRRQALLLPLPLLAAACSGGEAPVTRLRRPEGYAWLTPLRLNVAGLDFPPPQPGAVIRADPPAPLVPATEVERMGRDRLSAAGTTGRAAFTVETATLTRSRQSGGMFTDASERLDCVLRCRLTILSADGQQLAFAEAEARRGAVMNLGGGNTAAGNAEDVVGKAMDDLNVEFEVQVRRNLRDWVQETTPVVPTPAPGSIEREELPPS